MKKSKVKRFDMGGYAAGVQGAYTDSLARKAKQDKEDRIAADMQDAIEPVYPLENLAVFAPNMVRRGAAAAGTALSNAAKGAAERAVARQSTAEGLPSSAALRRALGENNPKVVTTKGNFEEFAGFRGRHKALGSPEARNKILREEAKEAGIPYKEYLKGRGAARAEGVAPGVHWRDLLAKGGKVKKYSGKDGSDVSGGDVLSNRDIGKRDPSLNKRKSTAPFTMDEMKGGLSTKEIERKTVPFEKDGKKFARGGKVPKPKNSDAGESAAMVKKEIRFMEKKKAPKSMIKHEKKEVKGMKCGGMAKYGRGGGIENKGYGPVQRFAGGGAISIDGCARRGHTRAAGHKK